jgi:exonuclease III
VISQFRSQSWKVALIGCLLCPLAAMAQTQTIRIVTYNTQGDVNPPTPAGVLPYLATVIEGIGQEQYGLGSPNGEVGDNIVQLPDIIALQETTSNSVTTVPLTNDINSYEQGLGLGANIYASSTYQATTSDGNTDGGGPNALIYNQTTLNLISSTGIDSPASGSNGVFRQDVMYEFQPLVDKGTSNGEFYVFDAHYKSGSAGTSDDGSTDGALRNAEAQTVRNYESVELPANAAVLYVGDFNLGASSEAMYQTLTAASAPDSITQGAGIDPLNPTNNYTETWQLNNLYRGIMTESDSDLRYRDDLQLMTSNIYNDTTGNLDYVANSYHAFGNDGSINEGQNIDSLPTNTALSDLVGPLTASTVLNAMQTSLGSDHLPVVADYTIAVPEPASAALLAGMAGLLMCRRNRRVGKSA